MTNYSMGGGAQWPLTTTATYCEIIDYLQAVQFNGVDDQAYTVVLVPTDNKVQHIGGW
jgi:hypothetical protein